MGRGFRKDDPIFTNPGPWCWQCIYFGQAQLCGKHGHDLHPYGRCKDFKMDKKHKKIKKARGE